MIIKKILSEMLKKGEIEIFEKEMIRFKKKRKRARVGNLEQKSLKFRIKTLERVAWLVNEFHKSGIKFYQLDKPLLATVVQRILEVDKHTAYEYTNLLLFIYQKI